MPATPIPSQIQLSPWKWLLGVSLLVILAAVVDANGGWSETLAYWRNTSPLALAAAFGLFALSHLLRAWRIYLLALKGQNASFWAVAKLSALHQFGNNLLPMRLGETLFPLLLKRYFGASLVSGLAKLIWLRLLDLGVMAAVILVLLVIALNKGLALALVVLAGLSLVLLWFGGRFLLNIKAVSKFTQPFLAAAPANPKASAQLLLLTLAAWFSKLLAQCTLILTVMPVPLLTALGGLVGAELSGILPIHGVAGAGSFEAAFWLGASVFGQSNDQLVALAVNTHIFVFASTTIVALILSPLPIQKPEQRHELKSAQ